LSFDVKIEPNALDGGRVYNSITEKVFQNNNFDNKGSREKVRP